jgi:hypothetical protein
MEENNFYVDEQLNKLIFLTTNKIKSSSSRLSLSLFLSGSVEYAARLHRGRREKFSFTTHRIYILCSKYTVIQIISSRTTTYIHIYSFYRT